MKLTTSSVLAVIVLLLAAGCTTPGYVPNGLHLPSTSGGYVDRKSPSKDVFVAEFWSLDDDNVKDDYALLRALERAYRAGYRYYVVQQHTLVRNSDQYLTTYEPRYVIQGFKEQTANRPMEVIITKIHEIERRRNVNIPNIGSSDPKGSGFTFYL